MAGLIPIDIALEAGTLHSGYRDLSIATASMLGPAGTRLRGHEFHFSHLMPGGDCLNPAYTMHDCDGEPLGCEGWTDPRCSRRSSTSTSARNRSLPAGSWPRLASRSTAERTRC